LGKKVKEVYSEEKETVILQRRCIRATLDISAGEKITSGMIDVLRPAPLDSLPPKEIETIIGRITKQSITKGEALRVDLLY